jgi:glycosyltransferase involved in cell wall biosynthesis
MVFPSECKGLAATGPGMSRLKISILTPSYNQGAYIERNILSVLNQNYSPFEHIVVDGGSTDNTIGILKKYPHLKWVSEKDNGQADALTKGLIMASGDIIGWINSDDFYEQNILTAVAMEFEDQNVQWVIGNIKIFYEETKNIRTVKSPPITYGNLLKNPDILKQQATFFRKSTLQAAGAWDASFHMVMDYDLWIRLAKISIPKMVDVYWAYFTLQPQQKSLGQYLMKQLHEIVLIMRRENAPFRYMFIVACYKYISFVKFSIKAFFIGTGLISKKYLNQSFLNRKNG